MELESKMQRLRNKMIEAELLAGEALDLADRIAVSGMTIEEAARDIMDEIAGGPL